MPRPAAPVRRALALATSGGVAAALAWIPAGAAHAAVQATSGVQVSASADTSVCTLKSGSSNTSSMTGTWSHGRRTKHASLDATYRNTGNPSDVVSLTGHYTGTAALTRKGGNLSRASVTGVGNVSLDAALGNGTACDPGAQVVSVLTTQFTESQKGWVYVERSTPNQQGISQVSVQDKTTGDPVIFEIYQGGRSHATSRGYVKPGTYQGTLLVGLTAGQGGPSKSAPPSSLRLVFHKVGSALSGTKGPARKYVELPGSIKCSAHRATLRWKPKAGQVASGSFLVNGKKKASVTTPRGGATVVLRHLSSTQDLEISARLRLADGSKATASRSYAPCRAV